ncbi:MAG: hypothetical protein AUH78_17180 [Gemmatimonadetes bacterium 13_1_40CM_4_69_8]|nr:MAG: hypothetical protein AUH78_17180 [Gemmatimonadetes bacterium 13_1_40CM_4_69_8]
MRSEAARWPTNFGGVDPTNADPAYRHGACTLAAQAAGLCVQSFVQQFNPLVERSPFRTALHRQYGLRVTGGSGQCLFRVCRAVNDPRTPLAEQARAVLGEAVSDYFEDAAFLKLRELSLTWYGSPDAAAALRAHSVAVTIAGRNLATWTGYSGADPEAGSYGLLQLGSPRTIADLFTLPVPRAWTLRLDLAY